MCGTQLQPPPLAPRIMLDNGVEEAATLEQPLPGAGVTID